MNAPDFRGARGSNAGDQFHELWALQQVLDLLNIDGELKAVTVEGVRSETPASKDDDPIWEGVDCALYYGNTSLESADRIDFAQLKYSSANPQTNWTVARLVAKKGNTSIIGKMASEFARAKSRMKDGAALRVRLISNQALSSELKTAIEARWSGELSQSGLSADTMGELERLRQATALSGSDFVEFVACLDFSACGQGSRFDLKERLVETLTRHLGDDVHSELTTLQQEVRNLMLPESARKVVTEKTVLLWFSVGGRDGLFPCPANIELPRRTVERQAAADVVHLLAKHRVVLIHGGAGCGKTTLTHQIVERLPVGSISVLFDCYGAGRYSYTDDRRHLPENAFLQLTNDLALASRLPLLIPRSTTHPAGVHSFMTKLRAAGETLAENSPAAVLLIIIDAADNSISAAEAVHESCFVFELAGAHLGSLPPNIRFIFSSRTARRMSLQLPSGTPEVICHAFTRDETKSHIALTMTGISEATVDLFHDLSHHIPRVQAYALGEAKGAKDRLLEALLPNGKSLPEVLKARFDSALKKHGQPEIFDQLLAALAYLPPPAQVSAVATVAGSTTEMVRDLAVDLVPGLRLQGDTISIADEDFEAFIKETVSGRRDQALARIAEHFAQTYKQETYSAVHVADAFLAAGRSQDILSIIDQDATASVISDPVLRRQVQVRRLKLSLAACRQAGSTVDAVRTVLISAEAEKDDTTLTDMLEKEMDLSVAFAGSSMRRSILLDPDRVGNQGSFLAHDALRAIRLGDRTTAREQLYFYDEWLRRRNETPKEEKKKWDVKDRDIAARIETIARLRDAKSAKDDLWLWRPRNLRVRIGLLVIPQLIASGKLDELKTLLAEDSIPAPWDLVLWVPLAMAGEPVTESALAKSLKRIRRRFIPDPNNFSSSYGERDWEKELLDTFITACELGYRVDVTKEVVLGATGRILEIIAGKRKRLWRFDFQRIDGILRCWLLMKAVENEPATIDGLIDYVKSLAPPEEPKAEGGKPGKVKSKAESTYDKEEEERLNTNLRALFPIYASRIAILSAAARNDQITSEQLDNLAIVGTSEYRFDHDHDGGYLRGGAAESVMRLLMVGSITAEELGNRASRLATGRYGDRFAHRRRTLWKSMRLRVSEAERVVALVSHAAEDIKAQKSSSSEKVDALVELARLILPISAPDAATIFGDAVNVAKEIDQEAIEQIDFLSVAAGRADIGEKTARQKIAVDIFAFISGAAERLRGQDHFPWQSAVKALTLLDIPSALAAVAWWADDGTTGLATTLNPLLLTALRRRLMDAPSAAALRLMLGHLDEEVHKELISHAKQDASQNNEILLDEIAKDVLLLAPQRSRLDLGKDATADSSSRATREGTWFRELKQTVEFLQSIGDASALEPPDSPAIVTAPASGGSDGLEEFTFTPQGPFGTASAIEEVLQAAASSGLRHSNWDILSKMLAASASPRDRIAFLDAIAAVSDDVIWSDDRAQIISEGITKWKDSSRAVDQWCHDRLPAVLVRNFHGFSRWLKQGSSTLQKLLDLTVANRQVRRDIILAGVAEAGQGMSSRALFGAAELVSELLDPPDAASLLSWYAERVRNRLPAKDQSRFVVQGLPLGGTEALGRFLFAMMSDVDTRVTL